MQSVKDYYPHPGMLPLHSWTSHAVSFKNGKIEVIEIPYSESACVVHGCCSYYTEVKRVKVLMPFYFGIHGLEFGACDQCLRSTIMPFWWEMLEKCFYDAGLYRPFTQGRFCSPLPFDLVVDGVYQHPYIMEGI